MFTQESALYGDLALWLRDYVAANIRALSTEKDVKAFLDARIHEWFFSPNPALLGDTPRDVIRREQAGEPHWTYMPDHSLLDEHDEEGLEALWERLELDALSSSEQLRFYH